MSLLSGIVPTGDLLKTAGEALKLGERAVSALERIAVALDCIAEAHGYITPEPERTSR